MVNVICSSASRTQSPGSTFKKKCAFKIHRNFDADLHDLLITPYDFSMKRLEKDHTK